MDETLNCPECGSDKVTLTASQSFMANSGEHYCHTMKTQDDDSEAYCIDCCWSGVRHNLDKKAAQ